MTFMVRSGKEMSQSVGRSSKRVRVRASSPHGSHSWHHPGVDVNTVDGTGLSPLLVACEVGIVEIVECLIENGADVNFKKSNGTTPLHIASAAGRLPVLELLIQSVPLPACFP